MIEGSICNADADQDMDAAAQKMLAEMAAVIMTRALHLLISVAGDSN